MAPEQWESVAGHLVRMARERAGMSQGQLAKASGVAQPLISRYEAGWVQPSLPTLQRLIRGAGAALTIGFDGWRLVDTRRGPTEEESRGLDAAFLRMLKDQPPPIRRQQDAARRRWTRSLRRYVVTDRPAFPQRPGG
jgi:transcriptional regulator with XRE-family HTH domain